jgi:hypothetical protein
MRKFIAIFVLLLYFPSTWGQSTTSFNIYPELSNYSQFFGAPNDLGYQFRTSQVIWINDSIIPPGLLVQLDHEGVILSIDTLRAYFYSLYYRVDTLLFLGGYRYDGYPDSTHMTYVFEICDLKGGVIKSFTQVFLGEENGTGAVQVNDSIYRIGQSAGTFNGPPTVYYEVNIHTLETKKWLGPSGIAHGLFKINNQPTYLSWGGGGPWILDTTFTYNTNIAIAGGSPEPTQFGTFLHREDKPGWFVFGGCWAPWSIRALCLMAINGDFTIDKIEDIPNPKGGNDRTRAAPGTSICKSGDAYYAAGLWNDTDPHSFFWAGTLPSDIILVKYDRQLNRLWTKIVGGDRRYFPFEVFPAKNNGFMIAGGVKDLLNNDTISPFTMFFDADGELVGTEEVAPPGWYEFTIYGNPGREALRIMARFEARSMRLQVVDVMGRPMLSDFLSEGMNHFDTAYWPFGTYFMSIIDESGRAVWSQPWVRE